ncbi:Xaa-Pro dipeptidase [Coralloluteibacterium stylophorae]|uniref:Xaa-Pro dipeptidase n=1 Tax=Coralloluteibacterium stylophorae TaxID=1776034 RepID=A0A8J8B0R5_9GAMM|nr:Xaa-Pro dipeptidase [Coralloluteibacterium stylophorae]MBS7458427.1 Xaa-Pro dipeptidase [Coralloluteibacterium stylophorae]
MSIDPALYRDHVATLAARADAALARGGFDHLLIPAGVEKYYFLDDNPYPFRANPHFLHWVPLTRHAHSWIAYTPGERPLLAYYQPDDYWHLPPDAPEGYWTGEFEIKVIRTPEEAAALLPKGRAAILGEDDAALPGFAPNNPQAVLDHLHYHRAWKTPYELALMRLSQRRAVPGHRAARQAFLDGRSEDAIHRAYLAATAHTDLDLPYGSIVGLNRHGATLHYQHRQTGLPDAHRSLLIDAGAEHAGYATDITRTWTRPGTRFADFVDAVEREELALCDAVRAGTDYRQLHLQAHLRLAGVLQDAGVVRMAPADMVTSGVTATFFPHGLGHLIGLQVHDVGGFQAAATGGSIERPDGHPYLRLTRTLEPGMVVTIEPGLYFIDTLLAKLRAGEHGRHVDWDAVEALRPYGGVRIEDDVVCTDGAPENLTRDAFAEGA